jgi:hypothetical protein
MTTQTLHGTTIVTIGEDVFTLVPNLAAVRAIELRYGGLLKAAQACDALSVDAVAQVIAAGAGLTGKAAEALPEAVFQAGVVTAYAQIRPYLMVLLNPRANEEGAEGNAEPATKTAAKAR